ncbi:MerR family transcriptional regulator [Cellulomonas sp. RIT-PI-Y]|uniref:MerR family transcriptional regulator n=1 Tax=Cellulomonas sp. RIT-PI-Y TaxID=3035297 RepID=UPI0021DB711D|nr:MerR family transcriptional regulator [Cellulomonas sp. RIT-PI-Y]
MDEHRMQIGELADRIKLSLRTIRYYEEVGLVRPSARTPGGFRLYTEADALRFETIKRMKPLDFSLEEMGDLLHVLDRLGDPALPAEEREQLVERLEMYRLAVVERSRRLQEQLAVAEDFQATLIAEIGRHRPSPSGAR